MKLKSKPILNSDSRLTFDVDRKADFSRQVKVKEAQELLNLAATLIESQIQMIIKMRDDLSND